MYNLKVKASVKGAVDEAGLKIMHEVHTVKFCEYAKWDLRFTKVFHSIQS